MHFRKLSIIHSAHIWNLAKIKVYASIDAPNSSPVELTVLLNLLQYSPGHYHYVTNPLILDLKTEMKRVFIEQRFLLFSGC